jgi:hypothetical protein
MKLGSVCGNDSIFSLSNEFSFLRTNATQFDPNWFLFKLDT